MLMQNFEVTNKEHHGMLWCRSGGSHASYAMPPAMLFSGEMNSGTKLSIISDGAQIQIFLLVHDDIIPVQCALFGNSGNTPPKPLSTLQIQ